VKRALKIAASSALVFVGVAVALSIFSPYTAWYFIVPTAHLTVDGRPVHGWLHRGSHAKVLFLTRQVKGKSESYMVGLRDSRPRLVLSCGAWTAPRLPAFPVGDVNPPCLFASSAADSPLLPDRNLLVGLDSVEFTADDGSRIKATW
jgi:hypothetical protein